MQQPRPADFPDNYQPVYQADEIDLFELVEGLWRRRLLILAMTAGAALLALVYVFLIATPSYVATGVVRPPPESSLAAINETGVMKLGAEQAFTRVVYEARSRDTQRTVFVANQQGLLSKWPPSGRSVEDVFVETFLPSVRITIAGMGKNDLLSETTLKLGFEHANPEYGATVANALIETADRLATDNLLVELCTALKTRITFLEDSLEQAAANLRAADRDEVAQAPRRPMGV